MGLDLRDGSKPYRRPVTISQDQAHRDEPPEPPAEGPNRPLPGWPWTWRRLAAALFVVSAALFVIGVQAEGDTQSDVNTEVIGDATTTTEAHVDEGGESGTASEAHTDEASGEANEAHTETATGGVETTGESDHHDETSEKVLGVNAESNGIVAVVVAITLIAAAVHWLTKDRRIALAAAALAALFAVFDVAEVAHQLDRSDTGLAVLAGTVAAGHVGAALLAMLPVAANRPPAPAASRS
jgi:hypothetical protein